jgi:hypothetical protein
MFLLFISLSILVMGTSAWGVTKRTVEEFVKQFYEQNNEGVPSWLKGDQITFSIYNQRKEEIDAIFTNVFRDFLLFIIDGGSSPLMSYFSSNVILDTLAGEVNYLFIADLTNQERPRSARTVANFWWKNLTNFLFSDIEMKNFRVQLRECIKDNIIERVSMRIFFIDEDEAGDLVIKFGFLLRDKEHSKGEFNTSITILYEKKKWVISEILFPNSMKIIW